MPEPHIEAGGRRIGGGERVFVIAEAGVNHNGDVELAKQLVDAALSAGADAVKFQTWRTEDVVQRGAAAADYQGAAGDQYELLEALELPAEAFGELAAHAARRGILFLSTPDDPRSADLLEQLDVPLFKIGSGELTNLPFLRHVARKGRPVILSTGMGTLGEVEQALAAVEEAGGPPLVLLHCVSEYPADPVDVNLRAMDTLRQAFGVPVGFSDHTTGDVAALAAVALGAAVIEKHLTLDVELPGPDHSSSLDPAAFADFVRRIRVVEAALGNGRKEPTAGERTMREVVRRRVLARHDLRAGAVLTAADVALLRAGAGEPAEALPLLVGRTLGRDLAAGDPISTADVR